jgi:hypothetical protein
MGSSIRSFQVSEMISDPNTTTSQLAVVAALVGYKDS